MENKLTNEEIAKVFAMYLGCEVTDYSGVGITGMGIDISTGISQYGVSTSGENLFDFGKVKLLLTPLSAITDEHDKERTALFNSYDDSGIAYPFMYQYLISKGYAVPLFFGINHWANGKTAIQLQIAIDKISLQ